MDNCLIVGIVAIVFICGVLYGGSLFIQDALKYRFDKGMQLMLTKISCGQNTVIDEAGREACSCFMEAYDYDRAAYCQEKLSSIRVTK